MRVEFFRHSVGSEELDAISRVFDSVFLTNGPENLEFERAFSDYLGIQEAVTTSSSTAALHLALVALGIGPGDEVVTTPMTFVATSNAILMAGAVPVFVDVNQATGLIDADRVESVITSRTKAILPVHLYGQLADMRVIRETADRAGVRVVEDAAHAIEAQRDGVRPGQLGDACTFSFYATKSITSGEGGALTTNDGEIAQTVRRLRNQGMSSSALDRYGSRYRHWDVAAPGWKAGMSTFQAAMLVPQLQRIEKMWARRDEIARRYEAAFEAAGIEFPVAVPESNRNARHLFTIWVDPLRRDDILHGLEQRGVGVAVNYRPIHLTSYYRSRFGYEAGDFPVAEMIGERTISLPLYSGLRDDEVDYVITTVAKVCGPQGARAASGNPRAVRG
ncbi:MAG: DegT/DnrJ/EryC1/StrS family aminotransferase [Actinomycetota bacterium]